MKKKLLIVLVLATVLATGTVFADHPSGLGIGLVGNYAFAGNAGSGGGLSLKIPSLPIFWTIDAVIIPDAFGIGLAGDYYFIDKSLLPSANLHWFFGAGGFLTWVSVNVKRTLYEYSANDLDIGVRIPVGLSWQPIPLLEIFAAFVPKLGVHIAGGYDVKYPTLPSYNYSKDGKAEFYWGIPIEIGARLWL